VLVTVAVSLLASFGTATEVHGRGPVAGPDGSAVQDEFPFVHQSFTGGGVLTVRLTDLYPHGGADTPWLRAGIMVKESTEEGAPYAAVMLSQGHGVRLQSNFTQDVAGSDATPGAARWLQLYWASEAVSAFESADGENWSAVGTVQLPGLPETVEVGMFLAAPHQVRMERQFGSTMIGESATRGTAVFDHVSLNTGADAWELTDVGAGGGGAGELGRTGETFTLTGSGDIAPRPPQEDLARLSLSGSTIGLIGFAALGVLFITAEYRRGMTRTTLAAGPRRGRMLLAKATVLAAVTFAAGLAAAVVSFVLGQSALRTGGHTPPAFPELALSDGPALRAVVGTGLLLALVAVFALGLGALLRSTTAALAVAVALLVLPGVVASGLPLDAARALTAATPAAGFAVQQTLPDHAHVPTVCLPEDGCSPLGPWSGLGVLAAYTALALALAVWRLRRRDA
jgi:hypothetical protein